MKTKILAMLVVLCFLLTACQPIVQAPVVTDTPAGQGTTVQAPAATEAPKPTSISYASNNVCDNEEAQKIYCETFFKDTGVNLEWVAFPKEEFEDKLVAALMGGDLYDVIDAPTNINPLVRQELLVDLAPLINANTTGFKDVIANNPALVDIYTMNDSIYGVAVSSPGTMPIFYRQDLLKELNLSEPKTIDEFTNMLRAAKTKYPDMIPMTSPNGYFCHEAISSAFGVKNQIAEKGGKFVDFTLSEDYREFLDYMKMLYADGLIDQELPTNSSYGTVRTKFYTGKAFGMLMWENTITGAMTNLAKNNVEGAVPKAIDGFETEKGYFGIRYSLPEAPMCITVGAKDPQFVLDVFYNWFLNTDSGILLTSAGVEGIKYEVVDGVYTPLDNPHGHQGQSFPAVIRGYQYPFKFDEVYTLRNEYINGFMEKAFANPDTVVLTTPSGDYEAYNNVVGDLDTKRSELYYLYMTGQLDYPSFTSKYKAYTDSIGLEDIINLMNQ